MHELRSVIATENKRAITHEGYQRAYPSHPETIRAGPRHGGSLTTEIRLLLLLRLWRRPQKRCTKTMLQQFLLRLFPRTHPLPRLHLHARAPRPNLLLHSPPILSPDPLLRDPPPNPTTHARARPPFQSLHHPPLLNRLILLLGPHLLRRLPSRLHNSLHLPHPRP